MSGLRCCDAGDVVDGEECIISITRGSGGHGKKQIVVAAKLSGLALLSD